MRDFFRNNFAIFNGLFATGLFMCSLFGFTYLTANMTESPKTQSIFGSQSIPLKVREEAKADLQKNLKGAKLNAANRDALNYQLFDAGLYLDENSQVHLYSDSEYEKQKKFRDDALLFNMKLRLLKANNEYEQGLNSNGYGLINGQMQNKFSANVSDEVQEEEEEEEVLLSRADYKKRVEVRQKLLMRYILITLDEGLRKSNKYQGKRVVGSEYIQGQLKKYSK